MSENLHVDSSSQIGLQRRAGAAFLVAAITLGGPTPADSSVYRLPASLTAQVCDQDWRADTDRCLMMPAAEEGLSFVEPPLIDGWYSPAKSCNPDNKEQTVVGYIGPSPEETSVTNMPAGLQEGISLALSDPATKSMIGGYVSYLIVSVANGAEGGNFGAGTIVDGQPVTSINLCVNFDPPNGDLFDTIGGTASVIKHEAAHAMDASVLHKIESGGADVETVELRDELIRRYSTLMTELTEEMRINCSDELAEQLSAARSAVIENYGEDSEMSRSLGDVISALEQPDRFLKLVSKQSESLGLVSHPVAAWITSAGEARGYQTANWPGYDELNLLSAGAMERATIIVEEFFKEQFAHLTESVILAPMSSIRQGHLSSHISEYVASAIASTSDNPAGVVESFGSLPPERRETEIRMLEIFVELVKRNDPAIYSTLALVGVVAQLRQLYPKPQTIVFVAATTGTAAILPKGSRATEGEDEVSPEED